MLSSATSNPVTSRKASTLALSDARNGKVAMSKQMKPEMKTLRQLCMMALFALPVDDCLEAWGKTTQ